jgi:hypothetical protein
LYLADVTSLGVAPGGGQNLTARRFLEAAASVISYNSFKTGKADCGALAYFRKQPFLDSDKIAKDKDALTIELTIFSWEHIGSLSILNFA